MREPCLGDTGELSLRAYGSPEFRRQTVKVEVTTGAIVKNSGIL